MAEVCSVIVPVVLLWWHLLAPPDKANVLVVSKLRGNVSLRDHVLGGHSLWTWLTDTAVSIWLRLLP